MSLTLFTVTLMTNNNIQILSDKQKIKASSYIAHISLVSYFLDTSRIQVRVTNTPFALKHILWVLVPTIYVLRENKKNIFFHPKIVIFKAMKNRCILHGRVFVMIDTQ